MVGRRAQGHPHTVAVIVCRAVPAGALAALQKPEPEMVRVPLPPKPLEEGENPVTVEVPARWGREGLGDHKARVHK